MSNTNNQNYVPFSLVCPSTSCEFIAIAAVQSLFVSNTKTLETVLQKKTEGDVPFTSLSFSPDNFLFAAAGEDKVIELWDTLNWKSVIKKKAHKRPTKVQVLSPKPTSTGELQYTVVYCDKAGDTSEFLVVIGSDGKFVGEKEDKDKDKQSAEQDRGKFLLGHFSWITDMVITPNQKYIITCDRDECIRISNFPNAYNIHCYCLGHTEFVSKLVSIDSEHFVSGSGDGTLRLWSITTGNLLQTIFASQPSSLSAPPLSLTIPSYPKKEPISASGSSKPSPAVFPRSFCNKNQFLVALIEGSKMVQVYHRDRTESLSLYQTWEAEDLPLDCAFDSTGTLWIVGQATLVKSFELKEKNFVERKEHPLTKHLLSSCLVEGSVLIDNSSLRKKIKLDKMK